MSNDLQTAINDAVIRRLAGTQGYQRGSDYYRQGQVGPLRITGDRIQAVVRGTREYQVELSSDEGILDYSCDCPNYADGAFCKHCVAVALAWINRDTAPVKPKSRKKAKPLTLADAAELLKQEESETLVGLMLDWAREDTQLRDRILQYGARNADADSRIASISDALGKAVRIRAFLDYRSSGLWARRVGAVIDEIEQLLKDGHCDGVIELSEKALRQLAASATRMDDSAGHLTVLRERLEELHFKACSEAPPDPVLLARRLFELELSGDLDVFFNGVTRYKDILGKPGIREYTKVAEAAWEEAGTKGAPRDFHLTHIMESLARASGDVDRLVAVMSRDLSEGYRYVQIAEVLRDAGRHDDALAWAEKGLNAKVKRVDSRLREFVANEYERRGRHQDAVKLTWAQFLERPSLGEYIKLQHHATNAGEWPAWRQRAIGEFRNKAAAEQKSRREWWNPPMGHTHLVEVFLHEKDVDSAWEEAKAGGCSSAMWLRLAAARENEHPIESAAIYLQEAEFAIETARTGRFDDAMELLLKAAAAMRKAGRFANFVGELNILLMKYKAKRNLMKLVDQHRAELYNS